MARLNGSVAILGCKNRTRAIAKNIARMVRGLQRGEAGVRNQEGPDNSPRGNGSICCGGRHVFGSKILDLGYRFEPDARNEFNLD